VETAKNFGSQRTIVTIKKYKRDIVKKEEGENNLGVGDKKNFVENYDEPANTFDKVSLIRTMGGR